MPKYDCDHLVCPKKPAPKLYGSFGEHPSFPGVYTTWRPGGDMIHIQQYIYMHQALPPPPSPPHMGWVPYTGPI